MFQFHKVRLKEVQKQQQQQAAGFQFHKVRLKVYGVKAQIYQQ